MDPMAATDMFIERSECLSCRSTSLDTVATGRFDEEPLRSYIAADPWGVDPSPFLVGQAWRLVRCNRCEMTYHHRVLGSHWNEKRFSEWMDEASIREFARINCSDDAVIVKARRHVEHILRIDLLTRGHLERTPRVLDFGCGFGEFLSLCVHFGFDAVGVDRSNARRSGAVFPVVPEIEDLEGTFDVLSFFQVLEHLDDPRAIIERLSGYLKRGAILIAETPNCSGVTGIQDFEAYRLIHPLDHINAFTPATLNDLVERCGFERIVRPPAFATTDVKQVARELGKDRLNRLAANRFTTNQYFRKL
jgi:2-polyprenyl-3-methyl-5-hydroxy-6-metoxy-1,4-benzoquinol methylase